MKRKLSTKGMFLDICSQRSRLEGLRTKLKKYSILVEFVIANNFYYDEELPIPSIKEMQVLLGLSYVKVRTQIQKIYELLLDFDINMNHPFILKKNEVLFYLSNDYGNSTIFKIEGFDFVPRKGERVTVPFFNEHVRTRSFYVSDVETEIFDDEYVICVYLQGGLYNSYWEIRKDQAFATNEIPIKDYFLFDYKLKQDLDIRAGNAW